MARSFREGVGIVADLGGEQGRERGATAGQAGLDGALGYADLGRDSLHGEVADVVQDQGPALRLAELLPEFPVALLVSAA